MDAYQIGMLAILLVFYAAYFAKMLLQRRRGIRTNQLGKGAKPAKLQRIERLLAVATYAMAPVAVGSILLNTRPGNAGLAMAGMAVAALGVALFIGAMATMRDSWRAGIPDGEQTGMVQTGLYRISRNPAFLGFDLMYLGTLLAYPNVIHAVFCAFAVVMLHLQILQEERYLMGAFGKAYQQYRVKTGRYFLFF